MQLWDSATGAPLSDCSDGGVAKESVKQHYRLYSALKYVCVVLPTWDAERLSDLHKVMLMNDCQDGFQVGAREILWKCKSVTSLLYAV